MTRPLAMLVLALVVATPTAHAKHQTSRPVPPELFRGFRQTLDELQLFEREFDQLHEKAKGVLATPAPSPDAPDYHERNAERERALAEILEIVMPALDALATRRPVLIGRFDEGIRAVRAIANEVRDRGVPACAAARLRANGRWNGVDEGVCKGAHEFAADVDSVAGLLDADRERFDALLADLTDARGALSRAAQVGRSRASAAEKLHDLLSEGGSIADLRKLVDDMQTGTNVLHQVFANHPMLTDSFTSVNLPDDRRGIQ